MSKIRNDSFTRSGIGCFIAVRIWQQWATKGYIGLRFDHSYSMIRAITDSHRVGWSEGWLS